MTPSTAICIRPLPGSPMAEIWPDTKRGRSKKPQELRWAWVKWGKEKRRVFFAGFTLSPDWEVDREDVFFQDKKGEAERRAGLVYEDLLDEDGKEVYEVLIFEEETEEKVKKEEEEKEREREEKVKWVPLFKGRFRVGNKYHTPEGTVQATMTLGRGYFLFLYLEVNPFGRSVGVHVGTQVRTPANARVRAGQEWQLWQVNTIPIL